VEVDTITYPARPGDLFLLCSDGLTTMLPDRRIAEVLVAEKGLEQATARLVREANEAGGRDNVTVIAFRLEEAGEPAAPAEEGATLIGPAAEAEGLTAEAVAAAREASAGVPSRPPASTPRRPAEPPRPAWRRVALAALLTVILGGFAAAAVFGVRQVHVLGVDEAGRPALYRGLPYELPFGVELYSEQYAVGVQAGTVPAERRDSLTDHELRSRSDAVSLLEDLERSALAAPPRSEPRRPPAPKRPKRDGKR
jgi:protein phosphatase